MLKRQGSGFCDAAFFIFPMKLQPKKNAASHDVVFTPRPLSKRIIDHFAPQGRVLDPCKGDGSFYDQFPSDCQPLWCEITQGVNFFDFKERVDWIVSNPPYSIFRKFLLHSMTIADDIVFLITCNHVWTKARLRDIRAAGFGIKEIYCVDTPRNFPQGGFQYAAVHVRRGWMGSIVLSFDEAIGRAERRQPTLF